VRGIVGTVELMRVRVRVRVRMGYVVHYLLPQALTCTHVRKPAAVAQSNAVGPQWASLSWLSRDRL